jgi:hypothetical protein
MAAPQSSEVSMSGSRRRALFAILTALGAVFLGRTSAQNPVPGPPKLPRDDKTSEPSEPPASSTKSLLEQNQKEIKKEIEKLYELATQLKDEIEKTDSSAVLSVALVKKAEEVEKLARQIKDRAKG